MIQLQLQPEIEAQLTAEAWEQGLPLDRYIEKIVEARLFARQTEDSQPRAAVEAMMNFSNKHGATLGDLDLKSMVHDRHKY